MSDFPDNMLVFAVSCVLNSFLSLKVNWNNDMRNPCLTSFLFSPQARVAEPQAQAEEKKAPQFIV